MLRGDPVYQESGDEAERNFDLWQRRRLPALAVNSVVTRRDQAAPTSELRVVASRRFAWPAAAAAATEPATSSQRSGL
jgi:hypothetical protein